MRYTKGTKIEVFSKREVSSGSWRPAEIISGNGHTYTVKYDRTSADDRVIGWVSRKAIRPPPSPVDVTNLVYGDAVEVFNYFSWKLATILKEMGKKRFLVQLHGSLKELKVKKKNIRVRQSWEENKWKVVGKRSLNCEDAKHVMQTDFTHELKSLSPYCHTQYQSSEIAAKKYRLVEKGGEFYRAMENPLPSCELAYTVASERVMEGKKRARASLKIRIPFIALRNELDHTADSAASLNSDSDESDLGSVGSCSTTNSLRHVTGICPAGDRYDELTDAESSSSPNQDEEEQFAISYREEAAAAEIHRFELHSYRCTLRALHASGPLSWERQSLISNLRLSLNISNDEHLMELKKLLSRDYETS